MVPSFFVRLSKAGVSSRNNKAVNRGIFLSNVIALIIASLLGLLLIVHIIRFSFERAALSILIATIIYCSVPLLNTNGLSHMSRFIIVINATLGLLFATLFRKLDGFTYESTFFVSRAAILILAVMLPIVLFHTKEIVSLTVCLLIGFIVVMSFDPVHNFLGIGYYQIGHSGANYYYNNFYYFLMFVVMSSVMLYLKKTMEDYESKYELSIQSLSEKNRQIETQKIELADKNSVLMDILSKKDQDLLTINQELLRKNNELMQFSFAISHNVRGPVATILGLMGLIDRKPSQQELNVLLNYLSTSVHSLDGILKGLNQIIDTKDDTFNTREQVDLLSEIIRIQGFLEPVLKQNDISIRYKLDINNLFTVRAYIQNILSQLITNGIQFRSTERKSEIRIITSRENGAVLLRVEDNGLGLDLKRYKEDLFRPFKRFHPTSSGKGIGLYLVKLQVEKLHGTVDVLSKPQKGFSVTIRLSDDTLHFN